jgi:hypothetical protein
VGDWRITVPNPPRSYDEIVRNTVLDPDGAYRPSAQQVRAAFHGPTTACEEAILELVRDALLAARVDTSQLHIVVEHDWVVLRGPVLLPHEVRQIVEVVERVPGVRGVTDLMVALYQPDPAIG